jgi:hypothetical protein
VLDRAAGKPNGRAAGWSRAAFGGRKQRLLAVGSDALAFVSGEMTVNEFVQNAHLANADIHQAYADS